MSEENDVSQVDDAKGAGVKFPPPLIFLILILIGGGIDYLYPVGMGIAASYEVLGIALVLFGVAVAILVNGEFKRTGAANAPSEPTHPLVTSGFYRRAVKPFYFGLCLLYIG